MNKNAIMSEPENSIRQVFEAYKAAVFAKDVEAFAALFDSDVRIFDMWDQWSRDGLKSWRNMAADWFSSLGSDRVIVDIEDLRTIVTDKIAVAHAFVRYKAVSAEGVELRALVNRQTWVLELAGSTWKIVHAHSSTPIEHGTLKAILQR
jgi:uncharacterized protein (TIGR02246 family)